MSPSNENVAAHEKLCARMQEPFFDKLRIDFFSLPVYRPLGRLYPLLQLLLFLERDVRDAVLRNRPQDDDAAQRVLAHQQLLVDMVTDVLRIALSSFDPIWTSAHGTLESEWTLRTRLLNSIVCMVVENFKMLQVHRTRQLIDDPEFGAEMKHVLEWNHRLAELADALASDASETRLEELRQEYQLVCATVDPHGLCFKRDR